MVLLAQFSAQMFALILPGVNPALVDSFGPKLTWRTLTNFIFIFFAE
jgi:hypothetical protein